MTTDSLGLYIHVPFCIQRCSYCDFATYARDEIAPNQEYVDTLLLEARKRRNLFSSKTLSTIYFGGGTPSLLEARQIEQIIRGVEELGFQFQSDIEITLEVNPATLTPEKCRDLKSAGVNRLSIGCQSFDDKYLQICNREHTADDTLSTIEMTQKYFNNYSLDLLFSLPEQGLSQVRSDLDKIHSFDPPHVSAYCLTLPEKHPMNRGRCPEEEQIEMFTEIIERFEAQGLARYELSNFSKPGFESRHNNLYWTDVNYWGLGLSAHSYKRTPQWGTRFWNPSSYKTYMESVQDLEEATTVEDSFPATHEVLELHESVTDYCHTHLRIREGLSKPGLIQKFGVEVKDLVAQRMAPLVSAKWAVNTGNSWTLTFNGLLLSNQVFANLLFAAADIDKAQKRLSL